MNAFDPDLLRTLIAFSDSGSLGRAASLVGRTPSAVTAQMQRLEIAVGVPLLANDGRGRVLTEQGDRLVRHARRILAANHEAWLSVRGASADGRVGIGITQDFADDSLPALLNRFAHTHPRVQINLRIGRSLEIAEQLKAGEIDISVAVRGAAAGDEIAAFDEPMCWLLAREGLVGPEDSLALALLDPPCAFREAALEAINRDGRAYRIAATSSSLTGLRAAVHAGLAMTVRTSRWKSDEIIVAPQHLQLPALPHVEFAIATRRDTPEHARTLVSMLADELLV
ncbi:MAG: LysR substrate-binding domain-containing protein [Beijerinckiaceae bacterium]